MEEEQPESKEQISMKDEKIQVKECSMDEIMKFMSKNREVLIPARLSKNMELVALFPEHTISK